MILHFPVQKNAQNGSDGHNCSKSCKLLQAKPVDGVNNISCNEELKLFAEVDEIYSVGMISYFTPFQLDPPNLK